MAKLHVICCQKGGVGKTTLAVNLGAVVSEAMGGTNDESPVLVIGSDPQKSMDWWANRVDAVPFGYQGIRDLDHLNALGGLDAISADYEEVFIDTPGSLEKEDVLQAMLAKADDILLAITPQPLTFPAAATTVSVLPHNVPFRTVINLWDPRDGTTPRDEAIAFVQKQKWPLARTVVRKYKIHERASLEGLVCTQYAKNRTAMEAREDFYRLALELGYGRGL